MLGFSIVFGGLNEFNQINAQPEMRWKPQAGCCENKRELEFNTQILFWIRTLRFSTKKMGPVSEKWCSLQGNTGHME